MLKKIICLSVFLLTGTISANCFAEILSATFPENGKLEQSIKMKYSNCQKLETLEGHTILRNCASKSLNSVAKIRQEIINSTAEKFLPKEITEVIKYHQLNFYVSYKKDNSSFVFNANF